MNWRTTVNRITCNGQGATEKKTFVLIFKLGLKVRLLRLSGVSFHELHQGKQCSVVRPWSLGRPGLDQVQHGSVALWYFRKLKSLCSLLRHVLESAVPHRWDSLFPREVGLGPKDKPGLAS